MEALIAISEDLWKHLEEPEAEKLYRRLHELLIRVFDAIEREQDPLLESSHNVVDFERARERARELKQRVTQRESA